MELLTVTFNGIIQAIKVTKENYEEVVIWLERHKIPCDLGAGGVRIYSHRMVKRFYPSWTISTKAKEGDVIVVFPFVNNSIINCWIVKESDFEREFWVCK